MARLGFLDRFNRSMMNLGPSVVSGLESFDKARLAQSEENRIVKREPAQLRALEAQATGAEQTVQAGQLGIDERLRKKQLEESFYGTTEQLTKYYFHSSGNIEVSLLSIVFSLYLDFLKVFGRNKNILTIYSISFINNH